MALVIEDGTGRADAESPNSIDELNDYHTKRNNTAWSGSVSLKEAAARRAADYMEQAWSNRLAGTRATLTQRLSFPRVGVYVRNKVLPSTEIAAEWKNAHAELCIPALLGPLRRQVVKKTDRVIRKRLGALEQEWDRAVNDTPCYEAAEAAVQPLLLPFAFLL